MKLIQYILDNPNNKNIDIASFIHGSLEEKIPGLKLTLDGGITPEQANKLKIIKKHYDTLTLCKEHPQDIIWD